MSFRVVDLLEMVDVDEQYGQRPPITPGCAQRRIQDLVQIAAIAQAGQRIDTSEPVQLRCQRGEPAAALRQTSADGDDHQPRKRQSGEREPCE